MKKMVFRVLAYAIDMILISIITLGLSLIPFVNPNNEEYRKQYDNLSKLRVTYNNFVNNYNKIIEDKKISEEEKNSIEDSEFKDLLSIEYDKEISDEDIAKIKKDSEEKYIAEYNVIAYKMNKNNVATKVITVGVTILYLGIIQYLLKGKTVGKMIFRLRTVNVNGDSISIPLWKYLIRAILIGEILLIGTDLLILLYMDQDSYISASNTLNSVQYIYEILFLIVMMMREDSRSIHDLLLGTKVSLYDKDGKEVIEVNDEASKEVKEEKEVTKKESKKKTTTKKTTKTKKKTSKKKEFVNAEKVNDK